jgi:subtilase family serine protease
VGASQFDNYAAVSLSGQMSAAPEELQATVPIKQWIAYNNFAATATWQTGAGYIKHQGHAVGDQYEIDDCYNVANPTITSGINPSPCATGGGLTGIFPITLLQGDGHPYETDYAADGTLATVQGLQMWIANNPKPLAESGLAEYRIFILMNGNVYMGNLVKDGAPIYYSQADGSVVNYALGLNQAAANSVGLGLISGSTVGSKVGTTTAVADATDMFSIGGSGVNGSLSPADLRTHYNVPAGLTGAGQTVVVIDAPSSADIEDDLNTYSQYYKLPSCTTLNGCFKHVNLSQGTASATDWGSEPELDVQMVHAIAPGAKIILVTAASDSGTDLYNAESYAYTLPGVTAVSMSFGGQGYDSAANQIFMKAVQTGGPITFASSGDAGYAGITNFPANSAWVIGVGGTRVNAVNWTSSASESGWQFSGGGSTTGSAYNVWMDQVQQLGARGVPDVAAVADFQNSAVSIYTEDTWGLSGGTSASAPIWAGFAALLGESVGATNQSLLSKLGTPQGGFSQILYQMAVSTSSPNLFYHSNSGSNNLTAATCALCTATGAYNEVTGLGAPNIANMVGYLGGKVPTAAFDPAMGKPSYKMMRAKSIPRRLPVIRPGMLQGI